MFSRTPRPALIIRSVFATTRSNARVPFTERDFELSDSKRPIDRYLVLGPFIIAPTHLGSWRPHHEASRWQNNHVWAVLAIPKTVFGFEAALLAADVRLDAITLGC